MPITLRPASSADIPALHALCREIELADRVPIATPLEEFAEWLDDPHLDLATDTRVAESGGELVGWGRILHRPSGVREERAYALGGVAAPHRSRGIGRALLGWQVERATQLLRAATVSLPRRVLTQAYDFQESAHHLFARHGFTPARWYEELLLDLSVTRPEVGVPEGLRIVPWDAARLEAARHVRNEAFSDHWGATPLDPASWMHNVSEFGNRPDLSFMALEDDRLVGLSRNGHFPGDEAVNGRRDGWILAVGVLRSHRGRGVASALLGASHAAFRAAGLTHSALGVDRDNPTGAYTLYERLGYRTMTRTIVRQLEV